MPKSNFGIKNFSAGIMANPQDERDIPTDAASYSLNIDPTIDGELAGIKKDKALKSTGFENSVTLTSWDQGSRHQSQSSSYAYTPPAPSSN